ncbi:MAG TPA: pyridoxamine 5'-phosphate oxidase family protein [Thermomicrobiales bacterium]|nr:pyridoxamine 5'-phosphate oxidase family protein [Thermomicrobiales bacterium]
MHESQADLERIQQLLNESRRSMGEHMRSILSLERRLDARELVDRLQGMRLLSLATVTAKGEPRVGPVDGLFYRGQFWFGSAPESVRFRHIRRRPSVSAVHLESEAFAVTVHGTATLIDVNAAMHRGVRDYCLEIYGESWHEWGAPAQYARIDADRMYTYCVRDES